MFSVSALSKERNLETVESLLLVEYKKCRLIKKWLSFSY